MDPADVDAGSVTSEVSRVLGLGGKRTFSAIINRAEELHRRLRQSIGSWSGDSDSFESAMSESDVADNDGLENEHDVFLDALDQLPAKLLLAGKDYTVSS